MAFLGGIVMVVGEYVAGLITERDSVTDPLTRRVIRLTCLLVAAGVFVGILFGLSRLM